MKALIKSIILVAACFGTMHAQSISSVAPLKGPAGTLVTITGSGFSSTASENIVFFGNSKGNVVSVNSAGTLLKVNTPVNPSYPSVVSVLNTSSEAYIESRFSFFTSFAARIDPETREIEDQFQSQIEPDQNEFNGDYLSNSVLTPFIHSSDILVVSDISNDGSMDFINQYNTPTYKSSSTTREPTNAFVNENPIFALTNPINASSVTNATSGFTKYEGYDYTQWNTAHPQGLDYPDVITSGYLTADLNNDGEEDFVNFGTKVHGSDDASFEVRVNEATSSTFSFDADDANEFLITAEGGQDYNGSVINSAHVSLHETFAMKGKAADMDGDGKKDLVFLLSYPKNMSKGSNVDRKQIIVLRNTTVAGSTSITFSKSNNYPTALSGLTYSSGSYVGVDASVGISGNSWSGLPTVATDFISDFDIGDINGDGKPDFVFKGISRSTYNWADTTVFEQINQTSSIPKTTSTNGTGFVYYAVNNSTSGSLSFGTPVALSTTLTMNNVQDWGGIALADMDLDGDLDIVSVLPNNTGSTIEIDLKLFRNNGSLSFTESTIDGPSGSNYMIAQIKVADINGDEYPDVLATISKTDEMRAFMRKQSTANTALTGASYVMKGFTYPSSSIVENPLSVSIADFSNDGKVDLVLQESSGTSRVVYLKNDDGLPQIFSSVQLSDFIKCTGQTSAVQTFQIGGQTISKADGRYILITAPTGWEVSKDPSTLSYKDTIHYYPNTNNEVMPAKTITIRMKASENNSSYSGDLEISTFNAAKVAIELNGSLDVPSFSAISPSTQYVNTTYSNTQNGGTIPTPSPTATSSPVAVELTDVNGTVQWQKSTDNSTWSDISGATATSYTLPDADLNNQGIVYLRAQITVCTTTSTTDVVTILENLGIPAPPTFSASNGQTLSGIFDESLATSLAIYDNTNTLVSSCSDLTGSTCAGWTFSNGTYTYTPSSGYSDGDQFYAVASNTSGTSQNSNAVTVDATAPSAPAIAANTDGSSVTGTAEAGSTVTLSLNNGGTTSTVDVIVSANGTWEYVPVPTLADGVTITATATDAVGNTSSSSSSVTVDAQAPTNTATYTNASGNALSDGTTVEGTTEPGAVVTVTMPNGDEYTTTADATTGAYSVAVSGTSTSDGDELTVSIEDAAGNTMPSETVTVDKTDPAANIYATDGTSFDGVLDGTGYSVTVSYGSGPTTQSATVTGSTFNWTPSSSLGLSAGDQITYTITDEVGNETTYTTIVQTVAHCIPVHTTGLEITELTFKPDGSGQSDVALDTYISDAFSDRSTTSTIELAHDATPELFISGPSNNYYYQVWVDYNQDGDFEDTGEAIDGSSSMKSLSINSLVFHSWLDVSITNPLPAVPFENRTDGSEYIMRIGLSTTLAGVSDPCGTSSATANFQDLRIKVLNCEDPASLTVAQASNGSAQLDVDFVLDEASMDITYVIAEAQSAFDDPLSTDPDTWISNNSATATTTTMTGVSNGTNYDYSFSATTDSKGNPLALGSYYSVAIKKSCTSPNWVKYQDQQGFKTVELIDPNGADYAGSDFAITSHTYTQFITQTQQGSTPSNTLNLPVGESLSVKTTVKGSDGSTAVVPSVFNYFDVVEFLNYDPSSGGAPTFILGTINTSIANQASLTALSVTNTNEVTYTTTPTSATSYWLTYTFKELAQGAQPLDAYGSGFANSVNVAWYEAPVLNSNGDGLTGAVPGETVTLVLDGTTYTATAGNDGTVALTSFTDGSSTLSSDAISALVNGSYSIDQSWTSGGSSFTHANPTQVLSGLSINAATNSVTGTAAPGATVTVTIGDETFTTTADATTGIYDFAGTTSSTTSPSTGVAFSTLVPFTATTAYSINQSLTGYTSGSAVTGSILASASDVAVPTIGGALALSGSSTTVAGTAEAGAQVYLYDEDGNQLFDANGDPITTTADDQGAYSITVDLSAAQTSTGSNTFASAYTSPYTGAVIQVGSTDTDGNTAPLSAAFVNPSVYTSSGTWTDASGTSISAPSTSGAATSSSPVIRYESNATLPSGITGLSGVEVASGATLTVPTDGCLDVAGSLAVQGTGSISLGAAMNTGGTDVESAQLKFTGEYLGPPTLEMNGQLFKSAHTIGSPMKEGFVSSDLGDETKLIGWDAYTAGTYYSAGEAIATQGLGFYAIVGSNQFIAQAGGFDVIGSPMSSLDMSLGYVADNYSSTSAGSGWNMIANPYTCGWNWGNSTLTNVSGTFYIYDVSNSSWTFWNSSTSTGTGLTSAVIPPLQGIWVQATSAGATISSTMDAAGELTCASGSSQNGFLKTANSIYKLTTVANGDSSDYSEMYLVDIAGAADDFDANYDAWHMNGHLSRGKLYNVVGAEEIVSNALEIDSSKIIDLAFESDYLGTTYELNLTTSDVDSTLKVVLEDRFEGTLWSMDNGAYTFVHVEAPVGMKQTRFALRYYQEASNVVGEEELDGQVDISVAGTTITVSNPEAYGEFQVYDASGRLMTKGAVTESISLPADNWENGIYRLVFIGEQITTISIVVNK